MDESLSVNSKMLVFMDEASIPGRIDVFTLANSKMSKGNGERTLTRPERKVERGRWEKSKLVA